MKKPIAEVKLACGRSYLDVRGIAVAMETDVCRDVHMYEFACDDDIQVDERGSRVVWTKRLLEEATRRINEGKPNG